MGVENEDGMVGVEYDNFSTKTFLSVHYEELVLATLVECPSCIGSGTSLTGDSLDDTMSCKEGKSFLERAAERRAAKKCSKCNGSGKVWGEPSSSRRRLQESPLVHRLRRERRRAAMRL